MPGGGLARVAVPRARMSVARPIRGGPAPAATAKASSGGAWLKNLWQKRIKRNMSRALAAVNSRAGGPQDTRDGGAPRASPLPVGVVPPAPRTGVKRGTHPKLPQGLIGYCDFIFQLQQLTLLELCALAEALGGRELSASDHEALIQRV